MAVDSTETGGVLTLALNWPERRNAMGPDEAMELARAFAAAEADPGVGVIVLRSATGSFCAGGDLARITALARMGEEAVRAQVYGVFQALFRTIDGLSKPLIAAVDGPAIGFGADLALAADLTIVGDRGWLRQGWAAMGLIPATGGALYVHRRAGMAGVLRFLAAERLSGADCAALGLAQHAPDAGLAAEATARALAALPRDAVLTVKRLARIGETRAHLDAALEAQVGFLTGETFLTRAEAFLAS